MIWLLVYSIAVIFTLIILVLLGRFALSDLSSEEIITASVLCPIFWTILFGTFAYAILTKVIRKWSKKK